MGKDQDLLEAARIGNITMVSKLLDQISKRSSGPFSSFRRSPCINSQDSNGYTPLHHACLNNHSNIVRLLIANNAQPDVPDIRGSTPLYLAAWAGHDEIVKQLLMHPRKPANPNAQTIDNETPLHCAAQHGHNTSLAILLAYGADPTIRNNSFQTALDLAAQFGRLQAVQILIRTHPQLLSPYRTGGHTTVPKNNECSSPYTISPTTHIFTHTCLHLASRNGHKKVVEVLLAAGVNVNIMTRAGTALHEAALCGKKAVVLTLLHAGVDPNAKDSNGRTALDLLKDYPPHVTYEITSAINDFYKQASNDTHFRPISGVSDAEERERSDGSASPECYKSNQTQTVPKHIFERRINKINYSASKGTYGRTSKPKTVKLKRRSVSMSSLEKLNTEKPYVTMKPINHNTNTNIAHLQRSTPEIFTYSPVYKEPYLNALNSNSQRAPSPQTKKLEFNSTRLIHKPYEPNIYMRTASANDVGSNSTKCSAPTAHYRCLDDYVKMTEPFFTRSSPNISQKKPFPSPRTINIGDYANINYLTTSKTNINRTDPIKKSSPSPLALDANNNKHSPTPDFPPPTVEQAEDTILEVIRPQSVRRSMRLKSKRQGDLESFIVETLNQLELDSPDSPFGSHMSDCVEEFVADKPFAGLFKGSTLNLANDNNDDHHSTLVPEASGLRSPSLVRSVKPIPAKRHIITPRKNNKMDEFNESKVWAEIDTILQKIGNEVSTVGQSVEQSAEQEKPNQEQAIANENVAQTVAEEKVTSSHAAKTVEFEPQLTNNTKDVKIRNPAELFIGSNNNCTPNWCHSPNTLIYGQILYTVYYLGSTMIKELKGTASTRKSIQKFKRNVKWKEEKLHIVEDSNNLTKKLKQIIRDARLKVNISLSSTGVKFIDAENHTTICKHNIENIHCVCQDAEDLRYFAYITKEHDIHYCHVFMVDNLELTREIILTLGEAFEVAYQLALKKENASASDTTKAKIIKETITTTTTDI